VADLSVTMEVFADEVQSKYRKWITTEPTSAELRKRCCGELRDLAVRGDSVLFQYRNVRFILATEGVTEVGTPHDCAEEAFGVMESACCEQVVQRLVDLLRCTADRLEMPYSAKAQNEITDDWRDANKLAAKVSEIAAAVRKRCRDDVPALSLPPELRAALDEVHLQTANTLSDFPTAMNETAAVAGDVEARIRAASERGERMAEVARSLKAPLIKVTARHLAALRAGDISLANDIEYLLENVSMLMTHGANLVELVIRRLDAAQTLDERIGSEARRLDEAVRSMRREHDVLQAVIAQCRSLVLAAPYRLRERRKPLPAWGDLSEDERAVVAAMIRLRHGDPNGEHAVFTQVTIETSMGHTSRSRTSVTIFRLLDHLDEEHQIVGKYPVPRTRELQSGANHFWIAEDAHAEYRTHVLGDGGAVT